MRKSGEGEGEDVEVVGWWGGGAMGRGVRGSVAGAATSTARAGVVACGVVIGGVFMRSITGCDDDGRRLCS